MDNDEEREEEVDEGYEYGKMNDDDDDYVEDDNEQYDDGE